MQAAKSRELSAEKTRFSSLIVNIPSALRGTVKCALRSTSTTANERERKACHIITNISIFHRDTWIVFSIHVRLVSSLAAKLDSHVMSFFPIIIIANVSSVVFPLRCCCCCCCLYRVHIHEYLGRAQKRMKFAKKCLWIFDEFSETLFSSSFDDDMSFILRSRTWGFLNKSNEIFMALMKK